MIFLTTFHSKDIKMFEEVGKKARRLMVGKLYSLELVEEMEQALEQYRKEKAK